MQIAMWQWEFNAWTLVSFPPPFCWRYIFKREWIIIACLGVMKKFALEGAGFPGKAWVKMCRFNFCLVNIEHTCLRENPTNIMEARDKILRGLTKYERMNPWSQSWRTEGVINTTYCWYWLGRWDILWKRVCKRDWDTCIGDWRNFHAEPVYFFVFWWQKRVGFKNCLDL